MARKDRSSKCDAVRIAHTRRCSAQLVTSHERSGVLKFSPRHARWPAVPSEFAQPWSCHALMPLAGDAVGMWITSKGVEEQGLLRCGGKGGAA